MNRLHAVQHSQLHLKLWPSQLREPGLCRRCTLAVSSVQKHNQREMRLFAADRVQQESLPCGIVVVDHGSRRKASNDMLVEFCQLYQQITDHPVVEPAHMEIAEPTIAQAVGRCIEAGAQHVVIAPYFLSKGRHIQDDIPALVAAAQEQYPGIKCTIADPIGIDPLMVKLIQNRVHAALEKHGVTADDTAAGAKTADTLQAATAAVGSTAEKHQQAGSC